MTDSPPRRVPLALKIAAALLLLLLAGLPFAAGCHRPDARRRLARHFDLDDVSTPESIAAGILRRIPAGTPEEGIRAFLDAGGIGKDPLSSHHPPDKDRVLVARIEFDPRTLGFVKEHYGILFHLDAERRLASVRVLRWVTGP